MHIHCSVIDERGQNIFDDGSETDLESLLVADTILLVGQEIYLPHWIHPFELEIVKELDVDVVWTGEAERTPKPGGPPAPAPRPS